MNDIDACVFDAYGTLFDVASAAKRCRDDLAGKADELAALWRTKQLEYTWLRSLMGDYADFWQITGDGLDFALDTLGVDDAVLRDRLLNLYLELDAYPEVPDMLDRLTAGGIQCAILSNGSPDMLASAVDNADLGKYLTDVLSVDSLGIYKPDPSVYQLAVDTLGIRAERICFMSSNAWDVAGAAHFGFRVNWVNRFAQKNERLSGVPENEFKTLAELPGLLGL
ncbi:MAG: haloacid dehalogenase type II [Rhodospirillaceae bacterium]|jgi:2-haloacid dehalogenase|nr:haloacid dehalogenase type II [Rhodospirillaceae bacterium]MBT4219373.1 haloacid dehalogenase type II [Rhodospirillaceae bacterium]MBT4463953.1 haloacid dehalogenase type II [Rhodospirillaceae bacterium]MBT5012826.1 haloacid dehalogenase type II [Rhodospirillaceae bacterium]MBT6406003.1 haloacid dehalogenase type II [Rhodospirillaceae bacterium]